MNTVKLKCWKCKCVFNLHIPNVEINEKLVQKLFCNFCGSDTIRFASKVDKNKNTKPQKVSSSKLINEAPQINTYNDMKDYLLSIKKHADNTKSKVNPSFTRKQMWEFHLKNCMSFGNKKIEVGYKSNLLERLALDF